MGATFPPTDAWSHAASSVARNAPPPQTRARGDRRGDVPTRPRRRRTVCDAQRTPRRGEAPRRRGEDESGLRLWRRAPLQIHTGPPPPRSYPPPPTPRVTPHRLWRATHPPRRRGDVRICDAPYPHPQMQRPPTADVSPSPHPQTRIGTLKWVSVSRRRAMPRATRRAKGWMSFSSSTPPLPTSGRRNTPPPPSATTVCAAPRAPRATFHLGRYQNRARRGQ